MPGSDSSAPAEPPASSRFATTRWSIVASAGGPQDSPEARAALAALCQAYWYPLYAYLRRQGTTAVDAQDLVQGFFAELLEKERLGEVDRLRGRFRSFLLASLKHYQANQWRQAGAQKRGGGCRGISLDASAGEQRYALEPAHTETAERVFQRQWALALLDQTLAAMRSELASSGKVELFDRLKGHLGGDGGVPYRQLAEELGLTEGALKVTVHRFRERWRALLRQQIAQTVAASDEVEEELRDLFAAVAD